MSGYSLRRGDNSFAFQANFVHGSRMPSEHWLRTRDHLAAKSSPVPATTSESGSAITAFCTKSVSGRFSCWSSRSDIVAMSTVKSGSEFGKPAKLEWAVVSVTRTSQLCGTADQPRCFRRAGREALERFLQPG
jgi:hypothetical protein